MLHGKTSGCAESQLVLQLCIVYKHCCYCAEGS